MRKELKKIIQQSGILAELKAQEDASKASKRASLKFTGSNTSWGAGLTFKLP